MEYGTSTIIEFGVIRPKGDTNERIRKIIKQCIKLCEKQEVTFVFIEGIQVQKNPIVYEVLAKLQGTLEICLEEKGYYVNVVKASEWRKKVGMNIRKKREALKKEAKDLVEHFYGILPSEDECEAILFARAFCEKEKNDGSQIIQQA